MTSDIPTPPAVEPASPYGAVPVAAPRAPLTAREKKGAFWAGAVGFNLLALGFTLVIVPVVVAAFGAFFAYVLGQAARETEQLSTGYHVVSGLLRANDIGVVALIGLGIVVIGLGIMVAALFVSAGILRSHGTARAWPVTWTAAGIAIVAYWLVGWITAVLPQLLSTALSSGGLDETTTFVSTGIVALVLAIVVNAVIGWLAWWWMAHALRRSPAGAPVTVAQGQE